MSRQNGKPLRFAALIRVSTEKQERQGESLRTQTTQIQRIVDSIPGGTLAVKYAGQEHATAGWERKQLDKLLEDAAKPRRQFDAVIVADASRWSRDNIRSETGLEVLRDNGVRFFVLGTEYDLFKPDARLFLGLAATIGAYHARSQKEKSILNRIERGKRGIPTSGKKPVGRRFDKQEGKWVIIPQVQAMYEDIAERYLAGEKLPTLAKEYGVNNSTLTKNLRERCGTEWKETFKAPDLNIDETVTHRIPRLLPEKTIKRVRERLTANRTYLHGKPKYEYLLSGGVFCAGCGYSLMGQMGRHGHRYYRHAHTERRRQCPTLDRVKSWSIRADLLEPSVVSQLFDLSGNPAAIERAVKAAIPNCEKLMEQKRQLEAELRKIEAARDRILDRIIKDSITDQQADKKLEELKEQERAKLLRLDKISGSLESAGDWEQLKCYLIETEWPDGSVALTVVDDDDNVRAGGNDVQSYLMMWESKDDVEALAKAAFGEPLDDGPAGAYISPTDEGYSVDLRCRLFAGLVPYALP